jgi:DNA-binding FrmR family transcriptional regulator
MSTPQQLEHRLNRIIGQIEGVKRRALSDDGDCVETLRQLKAAINGLKKFGEAYVLDHMDHCLKEKIKSPEDMEGQLKEVISSAFSL